MGSEWKTVNKRWGIINTKSPTFLVKSSTIGIIKPTADVIKPTFLIKSSTIDIIQPTADIIKSTFNANSSTFVVIEPTFHNIYPAFAAAKVHIIHNSSVLEM